MTKDLIAGTAWLFAGRGVQQIASITCLSTRLAR